MNIRNIPLEELRKDKQESLDDIGICEQALKLGINTHKGRSTQERLDMNKKIVQKIDDELIRRENLYEPVDQYQADSRIGD